MKRLSAVDITFTLSFHKSTIIKTLSGNQMLLFFFCQSDTGYFFSQRIFQVVLFDSALDVLVENAVLCRNMRRPTSDQLTKLCAVTRLRDVQIMTNRPKISAVAELCGFLCYETSLLRHAYLSQLCTSPSFWQCQVFANELLNPSGSMLWWSGLTARSADQFCR